MDKRLEQELLKQAEKWKELAKNAELYYNKMVQA